MTKKLSAFCATAPLESFPPFPPASASWRTTSRSTRNCESNWGNNRRCYRPRLTKYCEFGAADCQPPRICSMVLVSTFAPTRHWHGLNCGLSWKNCSSDQNDFGGFKQTASTSHLSRQQLLVAAAANCVSRKDQTRDQCGRRLSTRPQWQRTIVRN
jgi:hypothetical protein